MTTPISVLSRPRRHQDDSLAGRIVALQRKNANGAGPSRLPTKVSEDEEFSRGPNHSSCARPQRALYDPSRLGYVPPAPKSEQTPHPMHSNGSGDDRPRRTRPPDGNSRRGEVATKKLFNPDVHDALSFHRPADGIVTSGSSRNLLRTPAVDGTTPEEEADRDRERRRRREGSERGSQPTRRKDPELRSKGSRSSEGSESFKDRERGKGQGDTGVKAILKDIHNKIRTIEQELTEVHRKMAMEPEAGISIFREKPVDAFSRELYDRGDDTESWMALISNHKELADLHHEFLVRVFDPLVPTSYQQLAVKYNIPSRLWQVGFHLILERLRHAWMSNQPAALDLLTDLVYDAYKFYTEMLEDQALATFRTAWIEALGDLARYRMAIASQTAAEVNSRPSPLRDHAKAYDDDRPEPSGASIGAEVAEAWDVVDEETWRTTARDWYTMGITEKPGEGRLHHHLALLSRDVPGQEGRALHHFTKSLIVTHEYEISRESILPLFDSALQSQRSLPEATAMDLFLRLHGMLFTRIQLDDFPAVMSRFMERLEEDASLDGISRRSTISQVDWMLMASVNISAVMQYGLTNSVIRTSLSAEGQERRRQQAILDDELPDDGDGETEGTGEPSAPSGGETQPTVPPPAPVPDQAASITPTYTYSLQLTFAILASTLAHPTRLQGVHSVLNPYVTTVLTFISTVFRSALAAKALLSHLPWRALAGFVNSLGLDLREEGGLLRGPALPEDWAVRGMEWVGRRTFERGFWKTKGSGRGSGALAQPRIGERFQSEMDVLLASFDSALDVSEGIVDDLEGSDLTDGPVAVNQRRLRRVATTIGILVKLVDGLELREGRIEINGLLAQLLDVVEADKRRAEQERLHKAVKMLEYPVQELIEDSLQTDSENDDPGLAVLRERRQHLRSLLNTPKTDITKRKRAPQKALRVLPGFTMLVFDTNVLLSSLSLFSTVVEGGQWSVVVPLPVITELDGLAKNPPPLGVAAQAAVSYLEKRIRTHSLCLKIQTSKGNYLSDLLIRTEALDRYAATIPGSSSADSIGQTMDDRILGIASFQAEHFVDRSQLLGLPSAVVEGTKVLLVTFDRNLRLKARARGIDAADEKEMASILGKG